MIDTPSFIVLDADESLLLLIAKSWQMKENPIPEDQSRDQLEYIQACCDKLCDCELGKADVYTIYRPLFLRIFSAKDILEAYEDIHKFGYKDLKESLLSMLQSVKTAGNLKLDYSKVCHKNKAFEQTCISRHNEGIS